MNYYESINAYSEDGLIGGSHVPIIVENVSIGANASISRGELLCAGSDGVYAPVTIAADSSKPLAIAATDCIADSLGAVTQGYMGGCFNSEKVLVGGADSLTAEAFRQSLRTQNIILTSMKEA